MNYLQTLRELVEINSYTRNKLGVDRVVDYLRKLGDVEFKHDISQKVIKHKEFGDLLIWETKHKRTNERKILLSAHLDTVHSPELEFRYREAGSRIYGPGTLDLKGGVVIILGLLSRLKNKGKLNNISVTFVPDEELGSFAHKEFLYDYYKGFDYALVFEDGGKVDRYTQKRRIVTSRKGVSKIFIELLGPGGHSGSIVSKESRISAIHASSELINRILKQEDYDKGTTINIGLITGGSSFNTLAQNCKLEIDLRYKSSQEKERVFASLEKVLSAIENEFKVNSAYAVQIDLPAFEQESKSTALLDAAISAGKELGVALSFEQMGGGSDANHISPQGPLVLDGFGPIGNHDHTDREFIFEQSIEDSVNFSEAVVHKLHTK